MSNNIIWTPQPKQFEFMSRSENEALYGGAAGGGKTDCAVAEALRQVHIPHYRGLILRKTYPQLTEIIDKSYKIFKGSHPRAKFNQSQHVWTFPSGAKIFFGSMNHTKDRYNYQGKHFDFIDFDELTQFTWDEYYYLFSRNRPDGKGTRCYIRAQANPGGIGHGWVKERFITPSAPMNTIWSKLKYVNNKGKEVVTWHSRIFVPSTVFDNPKLLENDPQYIARLAAMPEVEKRALLYGDWDSFSGQVFLEWRNNIDHYEDRVRTHVISPFEIPKHWRIYRGMDWGYAKPFSVGWYAVDTDGRLYRIRELYGCTGTPDEGVKWNVSTVAKKIKEIESEDVNLKGRKIIGIADPAIWQENGGVPIEREMAKEGIYFNRADNSRIAGKMQVHNRLAFDSNGYPMFYCFNTCKHFIRTIPSLVYSETDVEDVDTKQEDHIYDEFRYICMENPIKAPTPIEKKEEQFDPLSNVDYRPYSWGMQYL